MSELRTEEEQIEALKNWWKSNGRSLLLGLAVALALVFGWKGWQQRQTLAATNASILYQNLVDAVISVRSAPQSDDQLNTAKHFAETLKDEYDGSGYAAMGALLMARVEVDRKDYDAALAELDWVRQSKVETDLKSIALLRSGRVLLAKGEADKALQLIDTADGDAYSAAFAELRGDILVAQGKNDLARDAYASALEQADERARPILEMKRDDLAQGGRS